jgi:transcriptional regulator with XRE-family HTH domain
MDILPALSTLEAGLKQAGVPVAAFCDGLGIHRATWQRWKSGKTSPTLREVQTILGEARKFGIEIAPDAFFEASPAPAEGDGEVAA